MKDIKLDLRTSKMKSGLKNRNKEDELADEHESGVAQGAPQQLKENRPFRPVRRRGARIRVRLLGVPQGPQAGGCGRWRGELGRLVLGVSVLSLDF